MNRYASISSFALSFLILGCGQKVIEPPCRPETVIDRYGFESSDGLKPYTDLRQAIACSKETGRPIFLFIHGYAVFSSNLPWKVFENGTVRELIDEHFVLCLLMVDDKRSLAPEDTVGFPPLSKGVSTIGQQNMTFQRDYFKIVSCPTMVMVNDRLETLHEPLGYRGKDTVPDLIRMLQDGLQAHRERAVIPSPATREFNMGVLQT